MGALAAAARGNEKHQEQGHAQSSHQLALAALASRASLPPCGSAAALRRAATLASASGACVRSARAQFGGNNSAAHQLQLRAVEDLRVPLLRHWNIYEALQHTHHVATRMQTWRDVSAGGGLGVRAAAHTLATRMQTWRDVSARGRGGERERVGALQQARHMVTPVKTRSSRCSQGVVCTHQGTREATGAMTAAAVSLPSHSSRCARQSA